MVAILAGLAACSTGCNTTKADRCEKYVSVYQLYLASTAVRPVSKEETAAAAAAALFLTTYCGWHGETAAPGAKAGPPRTVHGVPVIFPPGSAAAVAAPMAREMRRTKPQPNDPDGLFVLCDDGSTVRIPVP